MLSALLSPPHPVRAAKGATLITELGTSFPVDVKQDWCQLQGLIIYQAKPVTEEEKNENAQEDKHLQ